MNIDKYYEYLSPYYSGWKKENGILLTDGTVIPKALIKGVMTLKERYILGPDAKNIMRKLEKRSGNWFESVYNPGFIFSFHNYSISGFEARTVFKMLSFNINTLDTYVSSSSIYTYDSDTVKLYTKTSTDYYMLFNMFTFNGKKVKSIKFPFSIQRNQHMD